MTETRTALFHSKTEFENNKVQVDQTEEDTNVMTVASAISRVQVSESVVIVRKDIDLLMIMTG